MSVPKNKEILSPDELTRGRELKNCTNDLGSLSRRSFEGINERRVRDRVTEELDKSFVRQMK